MADRPNNTPQNTTDNSNLSLTGRPVLVQNPLGIFYGTLEKTDTRNGTVLLSDGFMISPTNHITYTKYLSFLNDILDSYFTETIHDIGVSEGDNEEEDAYENSLFSDTSNNEIIISYETFNEHNHLASITEYAAQGIAPVYWRTTRYSNTTGPYTGAEFMSLTNIMAIVPVNDMAPYIELLPDTYDQIPDTVSGFEKTMSLYDLSSADTFANLAQPNRSKKLDDNEYWIPRLVVNTPQRENSFNTPADATNNI